MTPEEACELLAYTTPGPWGRTGMGVLTDTDGKVIVHGPDGNMDDGDANLAAAAPDLAAIVASMSAEWAVEVQSYGRWCSWCAWTDKAGAEEELDSAHHTHPEARLVYRLIGPSTPA